MKSIRVFTTLSNRNVAVATRLQSGETVVHEYTQCGMAIYLEQDIPGMPPYIPISPSGAPADVRYDETLEDAVRRMFDEQDRPKWAGKAKFAGALVVLIAAAAVWFVR